MFVNKKSVFYEHIFVNKCLLFAIPYVKIISNIDNTQDTVSEEDIEYVIWQDQ